ncbi:hypothetical protein SeMB42_g05026 [Synchytrium endobioticum]|uniref:Uncharacterized protein n=1 Tax=Synchytrium endobioticum TaxID=286115 RepID=A0A507D240_9FUNG|nr:hypothetical protein SeMB42_g05026 [Synchytrium endobioticum]TPX45526.1 hypothetical protein SeLEV6574_g03803 [Synchytrium endobioticum]TPX46802.1 hypothetical protein SeLEV6574_g03023 [Synchytrium endobioticum]
MFADGYNKPFVFSEFAAAFHLAGDFPAPYISVAPGDGDLAIKRMWWRQSLTNSTFLRMYPRIKLFNLFEYCKFEETTHRDFQVTNSSNPAVVDAFFSDIDGSGVSIAYANCTLPSCATPAGTTPTETSKSFHVSNTSAVSADAMRTATATAIGQRIGTAYSN